MIVFAVRMAQYSIGFARAQRTIVNPAIVGAMAFAVSWLILLPEKVS
jgi:hypothetical protein